MLMFHLHAVFSLELIALAFGAVILVWSKMHEIVDDIFPKIIGYCIIIFSILNILCTGYYAAKYWIDGSFDKPYPTMMQNRGTNQMPMTSCPMMSRQMMGQGVQNQTMPMSNPMMQNQMNKAPLTQNQGTVIEMQKGMPNSSN